MGANAVSSWFILRTSAEFVAFLTDIVINQPRVRGHVIADNLSAHGARRSKISLNRTRRVICGTS